MEEGMSVIMAPRLRPGHGARSEANDYKLSLVKRGARAPKARLS